MPTSDATRKGEGITVGGEGEPEAREVRIGRGISIENDESGGWPGRVQELLFVHRPLSHEWVESGRDGGVGALE